MDSPDYSLFSNREYQLHWMRAYLEESAALSGIDHSLVSEADVESLFLGSAALCHSVCRRQNTFACNIITLYVYIEVLI